MRERKYSASVQKRNGKWVARLQYYSPEGRRMSAIRTADFKGEAEELLEELKATHKAGVIHSRHKTFSDLAEELKTSRYGPATYNAQGFKQSGVRDYKKHANGIARLIIAFGDKRLNSITLKDLEQYKLERLKSVSVTSTNRELQLFKAMLNEAIRHKYLDESPFKCAKPGELINVNAESRRDVTISDQEEAALLAQCNTSKRRHLRALIVTAVDSGCRRGELLNLRWSDIDFARSVFYVVSYKGKCMTRRPVPLTARIREALLNLRVEPSKGAFKKKGLDTTLVFGISDSFKKSFNAVRHAAGLDHVHFHDLRHTAASRLAAAQMNTAFISEILGHKNPKTTQRYINANSAVIDQAREIMEGRK